MSQSQSNDSIFTGDFEQNLADAGENNVQLAASIASINSLNANIANLNHISATSGTITLPMTSGMQYIIPGNACTFNASGGATGQVCKFLIQTVGTSSWTLTFGTNFKSTGTLATGTTPNLFFTVSFFYSGSTWYEIARTTAM